jgi:hypothetical protein
VTSGGSSRSVREWKGSPSRQPERFDAGRYLEGGVVQGETVGVELRADGEFASVRQVEVPQPYPPRKCRPKTRVGLRHQVLASQIPPVERLVGRFTSQSCVPCYEM